MLPTAVLLQPMFHDEIHNQICKNKSKVDSWFKDRLSRNATPIYSSYDIRDSGYKIAAVDANIYPAGFNNLCDIDIKNVPSLFDSYIGKHYGSEIKNIALLTEEHTANKNYWDNVHAIQQALEKTGRAVRVCIPKEMAEPATITSAKGHEIKVYSALKSGSSVDLGGFSPDLIVSNNDFTNPYQAWFDGIETPIVPPQQLGWHQRKKNKNFEFYNELSQEFADLIQVDPWYFTVETHLVKNFDVSNIESREELAQKADSLLSKISKEYEKRSVKDMASAFIKNNSGTYGLAVTKVNSGAEIKAWNSKSRKTMQAAKGGGGVEEIILQEGIPTALQSEGKSSEPVIYMVGDELAGGFLRTHQDKNAYESLNSPGAVYKNLCMSELKVKINSCALENIYGWVAKIGLLSILRETESMNVSYSRYT